jgi:catechol 2,3-dioxygenase
MSERVAAHSTLIVTDTGRVLNRGRRDRLAGVSIAPETHVGTVHLTVSDLERSLAYYRGSIGLEVLEQGGGEARLGAGGVELLRLVEEPGARPADGYTGLFHFALLVPTRADLAGWLRHAATDGVQLTGASDHYVSEALYLRDPDHHGIEIYADRPREVWAAHPERIGTWPLDIDDLLASNEQTVATLPAGTRMGHVHLRVADVDQTIAFYRDLAGFDLITQLGDQAAFLSAGGYHHHVGANTWESRGASPAPAGTASLRRFTVVAPDEAERSAVLERLGGVQSDPSGNRFDVVAA